MSKCMVQIAENQKETHLQASKKGLKRQSRLKHCSNNLHFGT